VSAVVTVLNDREGLEELLPALEGQTVAPEEVILVDGGSNDGTQEVLAAWHPAEFPVRLLHEPGTNIAAGRNAGIRAARTPWIACTDAGCRPDPGWLDALDRAAQDADIVAGLFVVEGESLFERAAALTHYPIPDELGDSSFLVRASHRLFGRNYRREHAGGRSMAFSKEAWKAAGGFPVLQYAGEDLAFSLAAISRGFRAALATDAVIRWRPRSTWTDTARMFFVYCRGDVRSPPRARHVMRLTAWTFGPLVVIRGSPRARTIVLGGVLAYLALPFRRAWKRRLPLPAWWMIPALVGLKDVSQIAGAIAGLLDAARGVPQPSPDAAARRHPQARA
jgi:GT2 family glycosyltransferase